MQVCVSDDYELGFCFFVFFVGLFSCMIGNLFVVYQDMLFKNLDMLYFFFFYFKVLNNWLWGCLIGYSMYLVMIENFCEINYCVKVNVFFDKGFLFVRCLLFMDLLGDVYVDFGIFEEYMISMGGEIWIDLILVNQFNFVEEVDCGGDF